MTTQEFNNAIPRPKDTIADGQSDFLINFSKLYEAFKVNHLPLDTATTGGDHNFIELVELTSGPTTSAGELGVYCKKVAKQTDQPYFRNQGNGKEIQLNAYQIYQLEPIKNGNNVIQEPYFSCLPGGIIVYFGRVNATGTTFNVDLTPAICDNILGVNICNIGTVASGLTAQANVSLQPPQNGVYVNLILTGTALKNQYYLIFGNPRTT